MSDVAEGLSRREVAKGARISPEGPAFGPGRDTLSSGRSLSSAPGSPGGSVHSLSSIQDLGLDDRWLIHPNLLFVGPKLGEGAHGKVYEGKYRQQTVAIKIIQPGQAPEERARREARFNREVTLLSRIKHKNLVKFVGACKEPVMVVVTEILQGGSLRKYMMSLRPKCLELRVAINYALDIAKALECLHKHGIIHRDLKPDNLLLTVDLKTVKLVDFGLAREETLEMMTSETGTYRWMAPELYSTVTLRHGEKKHYNHKVDVYSFSIVLWELLTNRMPFEGMSNLQAAYAAAFRGTRPTISESLGLSEELIFILQSCWAEDPDLRPNFSEIVRMLTSFLSMLSPPPPNQLTCKTVAPANDQLSASGPFKQKVEERSDDSSNVNSPSKPSRKSVLSCLGHCFLSGTQESLMQ